MKEILLVNIDKLHTTQIGITRIQKNLKINSDVVKYCQNKIIDPKCIIYK